MIVSAYDPRSGVVTAYRSVAEGLTPDGFQFDAYGFTGWRDDTPFAGFCSRLYGPPWSLTELLVRRRYDVIHCIDTAYEAPFFVERWLDRARYRGGVVLCSHNSSITPLTHQPIAPHVSIACSAASAAAMSQFVTNVRIIPNGVDIGRFRPIPTDYDGPPLLLWVGRSSDDAAKDLTGFLRVVDRHPEFRAIVVDADNDRSVAAKSNVDYRSGLTAEEMIIVYNEVRASKGAVISTSRFEGMSFASLEAAACGCPLVVPRVSGMEHLIDGETAILYDRSDDLVGLDAALLRLDRLREHISTTGRKVVEERHTLSSMAGAHRLAYEDAIRASKRRSFSDCLVGAGWTAALKCREALRGIWRG